MAYIYALSDIHGNIEALEIALEEIFAEKLLEEDKIIFCGDYVDEGLHSYEVLKTIMNLENQYPNQVVVLLGNHDEWFCEWLFENRDDSKDYPVGLGYETIKSFFDSQSYDDIAQLAIKNITTINENNQEEITRNFSELFRNVLLSSDKYAQLIEWLKEKYGSTRYYKTEKHIFVHAGIDEEASEWWRWGTPDEMFTNKYPATLGFFEKTIIGGHIYSEEIGGSEYLGKVFWDRASHFYIDGHTSKTGVVPVLKYDTKKSIYVSGGTLVE